MTCAIGHSTFFQFFCQTPAQGVHVIAEKASVGVPMLTKMLLGDSEL